MLAGFNTKLTAENYRFEPMLTLQEAAKALALHPDTVKKMAQTGRIPAVKLGKYWRFRLSELDAWLKSKLPSGLNPTIPRN